MEQPPPSKRKKLDPQFTSADEDETPPTHLDRSSAGRSTPNDQTTCSSFAASQERSGNEIQEQRDQAQGKVTMVDLQPTVAGRPVSVASEPITYVPPLSVLLCPVSTQSPVLGAEPNAATDFVALTTVTTPSTQTHPLFPPSLESAQEYNNPTSVVEGQATAQNPHVSVCSKNIVTQSRIGVSNYPTPTAVVTQQSHVTDASLQPAICQPLCTSTSKRMPYSASGPQIQIESTKTSLQSRGITSCDLLPLPPSSEEALVKATVAGFHYAATLQSQSVTNIQKCIPEGSSVPQSMKSHLLPPRYSMATTPQKSTSSVALQMSTHQPIPSLQLTEGASIDGHLLSGPLPSIIMADDETSSLESRLFGVKRPVSQIFGHSVSSPQDTPSCDQILTSLPAPSVSHSSSPVVEYDSNQTTCISAVERRNLQGTAVPTTIPKSINCNVIPLYSEENPLTSIDPNIAGDAFRKHRGDLLQVIAEPHFALFFFVNSLYSSGNISQVTLDKMKLPGNRRGEQEVTLLDDVEKRIRPNPANFRALLSLLSNDRRLCVIGEEMKNTYCKLHTSSSLSVQCFNLTSIQKLDMYLSNYYNVNHSKVSLDTKFPHLPNKDFITLAVIEKERIRRADADKFTKGTLLGHADEILQKKKPIDLEAVLEPPEGCQNMRCVFVEGAPGIGKSTFALELCRRRREIRTMKDYSLVLLLRLREKRVQAIEEISDLFYHDNTDLVQAVTEEVVACQGKNVLFVLDGFDELPDNLRRDSFIVKLIRGDYLPACTILVTSRPSATADLQLSSVNIDKHIEILGFTHEYIQQYAMSMLSDQPDVLEDFLKYISNNPAIHGMMYIPLNSAIVLEIYKAKRTTKRPNPCTLTQLYTELSLVLLRKYLVETGHPLADKLQDKLEDLPEDIMEQLKKLGKLAFEGAMSKDITFEKLPEGCSHLGFMNISTNLYMGRKSIVSYSFLHLTLQEFLAAYYISLLDCVYQKLFIDSISGNAESLMDSHLTVVLRFIAGLTKFENIGWDRVHHAMIFETEMTQISYSPLFARCLLEVQSEQNIREACDAILNSMQRSVGTEYDRALIEKCGIQFEVGLYTLFDCYAVGRCVAASGCKWSLEGIGTGMNEAVDSLAHGLNSVGKVCGSISELRLSLENLTHHSVARFSQFPTKILTDIRLLNLRHNRLDKTALDCLADSLFKMANLNELDLSGNPGGDCGMVKVFRSLLHTSKILSLSVHKTTIGLSDIEALSQLIRPGSSLKQLKIGDKDMPCEATVKAVLSPSSLEIVELWGVDYTAVNASTYQLLKRNRNLERLKFNESFGDLKVAVLHLVNALHNNESLQVLGMDKARNYLFQKSVDPFPEYQNSDFKTVEAITKMIEVNTTLEELELPKLVMTTDQVFILSDALQMNEALTRVTVKPHGNIIDPRINF